MSRVVGILQARMGSTRLPGKMLMPLAGETVLYWAVRRALRARLMDDLVLATSNGAKDDSIEELANRMGVACFRGSEVDVLDRYYQAARKFNASDIVRLTGDNPVVDGGFIDWVVSAYAEGDADYVAAVPGNEWGLPAGLAAEVFSFDSLSDAWREDRSVAGREHVTPYIRQNPSRFALRYLSVDGDYSGLRLTVDTEEDLASVRVLFEHFSHGDFSWEEALTALRCRPQNYVRRDSSERPVL